MTLAGAERVQRLLLLLLALLPAPRLRLDGSYNSTSTTQRNARPGQRREDARVVHVDRAVRRRLGLGLDLSPGYTLGDGVRREAVRALRVSVCRRMVRMMMRRVMRWEYGWVREVERDRASVRRFGCV